MAFKIGDKVRITTGPINKCGKEGEITTILSNGVVMRFPDWSATVVKFDHLELV